MTALSALLVLGVGLIALREHRRANRTQAAFSEAKEAADEWSRIAEAEFQNSELLRTALRLENDRYDAAFKVLFVQSPSVAIAAIDDIEAGHVPEHIEEACRRGGFV